MLLFFLFRRPAALIPLLLLVLQVVVVQVVSCLPSSESELEQSQSNVLNASQSRCRLDADFKSETGVKLEPSLRKHEGGLLLIVGFGGFSVLLALFYNLIRRHVYDDVNNVDSTFDAGGDVSSSLTGVTIAAQLLWPADLMQSVTFAVKYGIAGAFWYCGAAMVNLSLFPLLSFKFKTRAPGAKTFLQIILARFGSRTHLVFCVFALLLNIVVIATILIGGIAVMQATIEDVSPEFCLLSIVTLCGSYSLIGGLGSTFYVSYFNALVTYLVLTVLIVKIIYSDDEPFGSLSEIYDRVNCGNRVDGNMDGSRFTFLSEGASIVCVQSVFLVASITYCDQASWQSRIAAKPLQGAVGFLFGAFVWFSVPASIGLVTGLTYVAEASRNQTTALSLDQIDSGIVSTYMAQRALGSGGMVMMLTMIMMLTMSTGSGEIMAISAIVVYDLYQTYINPFRRSLEPSRCILCGNTKHEEAPPKKKGHDPLNDSSRATCDDGSDESMTNDDLYPVCTCPSSVTCPDCKTDVENKARSSEFGGGVVIYRCPHHGYYRTYQDSLINFKNWCLLWVSIVLVPLGLVMYEVGVDLNWLMIVGAIITVPSFPGVIMSVTWAKATAKGLIIGVSAGFICGISTNFAVAYTWYEGQGGFFRATSELYAALGGSLAGGMVSLILTTAVSLCTHRIRTPGDEREEWEKLRNIDNPLHPWSEQFAGEFPEVAGGVCRPSQKQLEQYGRKGKLCSVGGSIAFILIFIVTIPAAMSSLQVLSVDQFQGWTMFITVWLIVAACIMIVVTPVEEIYRIVQALRHKLASKQKTPRTSSST